MNTRHHTTERSLFLSLSGEEEKERSESSSLSEKRRRKKERTRVSNDSLSTCSCLQSSKHHPALFIQQVVTSFLTPADHLTPPYRPSSSCTSSSPLRLSQSLARTVASVSSYKQSTSPCTSKPTLDSLTPLLLAFLPSSHQPPHSLTPSTPPPVHPPPPPCSHPPPFPSVSGQGRTTSPGKREDDRAAFQ